MDDEENGVVDGTDSQGPGTGDDTGSNGHPAWQEYLTDIPEAFHPVVSKAFGKWDSEVNGKLQSLHSQYEPWKDVIDTYDPTVAEQSFALFQRLNEDPKMVYEALGNAFGFTGDTVNTGEQGTGNEETDDSEDEFDSQNISKNHPLYKQVNEQRQMLEMLTLQQQQEAQQRQAEADEIGLNNFLGELAEKHGEFDEDYVVTLMANGVPGEQAVQRFHQLAQSYAEKLNQPSRNAPVVLSSSGGGSLPSNQIDPTQLSDKDTKALIVQMLAQANTS